MKLASFNNGTRDGQLIIVNSALSHYLCVMDIATTMQALLDDWQARAPYIKERFDALEADSSTGKIFDETQVLSPLPRAYQWADGSAYVNHVELVRKARGAEMPETFWSDPLMYQGGSDDFCAPHSPIYVKDTATWGVDFEAEIAVIVDDVKMGASEAEAARAIRLIMLVNDVSLRGLIPVELGKGFGFFQSKPASTFSPVAITPNMLGDKWTDGTINLPMEVDFNNEPFGRAAVNVDMVFNMPRLVSHAAKTRNLRAGSIIGSGTISNKSADGSPGKPISDGGVGYSCIAEIRMIETINDGTAKTRFMQFGDNVKIRMLDENGKSLFGEINQSVAEC